MRERMPPVGRHLALYKSNNEFFTQWKLVSTKELLF